MNALPDGFRSDVRLHASYDHRSEPRDQRGAQGFRLSLNLHGPEGVISAQISTGWMLRPLKNGWRNFGADQREDRIGVDSSLTSHYPSGSSVSLHCPVQVKDWWYGPSECDLLGGQECYGDTGYLVADEVLRLMVESGDEAVWPYLLDIYHSWLRADVSDFRREYDARTKP